MLKVFLGNSPWNKPGFYGVRAGSRWPHFEVETNRYMPFPFQLAYATALLEKQGVEVMLVDAIAERISVDRFIDGIGNFSPDLIILEISTPSFSADMAMVDTIRERIGKNVLIGLCGPHKPMTEHDFLQTYGCVDFCLVGEYELTLCKTVGVLSNGDDLGSVPGLVYRRTNGQSAFTGKASIIKDPDELPWPARHLLPMSHYFDNPGNIPEPALQMWASRGCPYSCSYCIWPQLMDGNTYRPRNPTKILDEMEHICGKYGYKSVYFDDDTFNIGKNRMLDFCREKIRRKIDIPWAIMARADLMDREILEAMASAGLKGVKYGIESASPELIARVGKNLDLKKAIDNIEITKNLGIKVHLTFMFGIPGETFESARKTVALAKKLNPESVQFSVLTPLPGTAIYDELLEKGHLQVSDWGRLDGYFSSVVRTDSMSTEDLEKMVQYAWRSWAKHKAAQGLSGHDVKWLIKNIPRYLVNPRAAWHQVKRLMM